MKKKILSLAVVAVMLVSCGGEKASTEENSKSESENVEQTEELTNVSSKIYEIESGIYSYETDVMGMKIKTSIYFDDYGAREETVSEASGMLKTHSRTFNKEGYSYTIDMVEKTASKVKIAEMADAMRGKVAYALTQMTEEERKIYDFKEEGTADVLSYTCKVYSSLGLGDKRTKSYLYKGVALKVELGEDVVMEAAMFEENAEMPDWFYTIPEGIEVEEVKIPEDMEIPGM